MPEPHDLVKRHKIRDVDLLTRIVGYVMSETGHTFSVASIQRYLKHENRTLEAIVYRELVRRGYAVKIGRDGEAGVRRAEGRAGPVSEARPVPRPG